MRGVRCAALLVAAWACGGSAWAQERPAAVCPVDAQALPLGALFGQWEARLEGAPGVSTVELARHPEYAGVRGKVRRPDGTSAELAGDVDDEGLLALDESQDGRAISATWSGTLQAASCGEVFEGTWRRAADDYTTRFTLRKLPAGGTEGNPKP
ncbi:MAG: hypothetical protein ABWZ88_21635 [Variovorax sp.]